MSDLRYAIRVLLARPGFSAVAILTLALGIGANTAIFTVVNAVLLRPLPFREPDQLVMLLERTTQLTTVTTSWQNYVDWRDQTRSYDAVAAMRSLTMTMTGDGEPERIPARMVSAHAAADAWRCAGDGTEPCYRRRSPRRGRRRAAHRCVVAAAVRR
jgi:hypothetical protein